MKVLINILKIIIITILTICILFLGIKNIFSSTILDQSYITSKLEETNLYHETYELVKSNFENYIYQSGLDEIVLEDICTEEKVKKDLNTILSNIYQGTDVKIDTTEIADNLNKNIDELDIKTSSNAKAIDQFVQHICDEYTDTILHTKYETSINEMYSKAVALLEKINKIVMIATVVSAILLIILNIKNISKLIQNLGTALLASSVFVLVAHNIVITKVYVEGIKVFNDAFSNTLVAILKDVLQKIQSLGIVTLIIAIVLIIVYAIIVFCKPANAKHVAEEE